MADAQVPVAVAMLLLVLLPLVGWRIECALVMRSDPTPPESPPPAHGIDGRG